MKKFPLSTLCIIVLAFALPLVSLAADDYNMLAPIPQLTGGGNTVDLGTYIPNMIKLIIAIASGLAVIKIIIGGIQYMSTDAVSGKNSGRDSIQDALVGLLLAISAYTILYTVNPKLLNLDLNIDRQAVGQDFNTDLGDGQTPEDPGRTTDPGNWITGASWPDDQYVRDEIKATVGFNHPNCKKVGEMGCTSLYQLAQRIRDGLKKVQAECKCDVQITGGTEFWLHGAGGGQGKGVLTGTEHRPGGRVVDLSITSDLTNFLKKYPSSKPNPECTPGAERYEYKNGGFDILFVNEDVSKVEQANGNHYHVCFY